jgi:hypothetical protein
MAGEPQQKHISIEDLCAGCHPDRCCTLFLWVSNEDVERWNAEGRHDILTHIRARVVEERQAHEIILQDVRATS